MPMPPDVLQPVFVALLGIASANHDSNQPPDAAPVLTISGKAHSRVAPAVFYAFTPTVRHSGDRKLVFSVLNKPSWLSFGRRRGTLYGSPQGSDIGTYTNITITVSDGNSTVQLPPFAIQVGPPIPLVIARNPTEE
jgi:hypothetical protein